MRFTSFLLLLMLGFTSCVSSRIESNVVPGFNKKVERIYVKVYSSKESREILSELTREVQLLLVKRKVEVKWNRIDELDLGEDAAKVQEEMAFFQPDLILTIKVEKNSKSWRYQPNGGGYYHETSKLSATLGSFPLDQAVWKGVMQSYSNIPGMQARNVAKKLVARLEEDGIINRVK